MRTKRKHIGLYCDAKKKNRFCSDFDNTCIVLVVMYYIYAYMFNGFSSKAQSAWCLFYQSNKNIENFVS